MAAPARISDPGNAYRDAWLVPLIGRTGNVQGHAVVDRADFAWLNQWRWHVSGGYAKRGYREDGRFVTVNMHRLILGLELGDPRQADHINGRGLDNRRENLRVVTHAENAQNRKDARGSSRFRGVTFHRASGKWAAQVGLDGVRHYLGLFANEEEAAQVAAAFRAEHMPYSQEAAA